MRIRKSWFTEYTDKYLWLVEKCRVKHEYDLTILTERQKDAVRYFLSFYSKPNAYHISNLLTLVHNNVDDYKVKIDRYHSTESVREKIEILKGKEAADEYYNKISLSNKTANKNSASIEFWKNKGYSLEESTLRAKESAETKTANMRNSTKPIYTKDYNPYKVDWWCAKGMSIEEANEKVEEIYIRSSSSLEGFIERYGIEKGTEYYNAAKIKRKTTMLSRYGVPTMLSGKTSKESIQFFLPLYKKLRRLGIEKTDIFWGINGTKEFASHNKGYNYFYDFVIYSLKICIEYNGSLWHPKDETSESSFYNTKEKLRYDKEKIQHLIERGFDVIIVWDTDDHTECRNLILEKVKNAIKRERL
jgi:very-short-patch-repair endonuclease